jgi:hypothetical protein
MRLTIDQIREFYANRYPFAAVNEDEVRSTCERNVIPYEPPGERVTLEAFADRVREAYQPYYAAYLLAHGYQGPPETNFEYINWIGDKHREFRALNDLPHLPYDRETQVRFIEWLGGINKMMPYEDPNNKGNSAKYHTGKPCIEPGCNEPAGTGWGPYWCMKHNAERINRINKSFDDMLAKSPGGGM